MPTLHNKSEDSRFVFSLWIHCELSYILGVDLTCSYSADFGPDARLEWKFKDMKGSQTYIVYDKKVTGKWVYSLCLCLFVDKHFQIFLSFCPSVSFLKN